MRSHRQPGGGHAKVVYRGLAWARDGCVSPPCPPSLSSPPSWRLSRWRARRRAVPSPCCVCVCFLLRFPVSRTTGRGPRQGWGNLPCARAGLQGSHLAHEQRVPLSSLFFISLLSSWGRARRQTGSLAHFGLGQRTRAALPPCQPAPSAEYGARSATGPQVPPGICAWHKRATI